MACEASGYHPLAGLHNPKGKAAQCVVHLHRRLYTLRGMRLRTALESWSRTRLREHGVEDGLGGIMRTQAVGPTPLRGALHDPQAHREEGHEHGRDEQREGLRAPQQGHAGEECKAVALLGAVEGGNHAQDEEGREGCEAGNGLLEAQQHGPSGGGALLEVHAGPHLSSHCTQQCQLRETQFDVTHDT